MSYFLSEEQTLLRQTVREFAEAEIGPHAIQWDEEGVFPKELLPRLAELGLMGVPVPEEYGGAGMDTLAFSIAVEELARVDGSIAITVAAHTGLATLPILMFGTEEQRRRWVTPLAGGEALGAFALTEPEAGSDSAATQTTARRDGDAWVVNGQKQFCTNGSHADIIVFTAQTDRSAGRKGICAFVVEKGTPGFEPGKKEDKLGFRASDTAALHFDDCRIPVGNMLGEPGRGFQQFMQTLEAGRVSVGALGVGLAQGAYERALGFSKERQQFGRPIAAQQAIQFMLADMAMQTHLARLAVYHAARLRDAGQPFAVEACVAKLYASEAAYRVTKDAVQVYGGMGYTQEYEVERFFRDAKLCEIGEGTSEIQRHVIARAILA